MLETKMYKLLKIKMARAGMFLYRVERKGGKVPDTYFASKYGNGWIELKQVTVSKNRYTGLYTYNVPFRIGQLPWIKEHIEFNPNVFVIATIGDTQWLLFTGDEVGYKVFRRRHKVVSTCNGIVELFTKQLSKNIPSQYAYHNTH